MRITLLYPPPWKIPAPGEPQLSALAGGPPANASQENFVNDMMNIPYGLMSMGALARSKGYEVDVVNLYSFAWQDITAYLKSTEYQFYGLSCFTSNRLGVFSLAQHIRLCQPQAHIAIGGPFASALPYETLQHCPAIDTVVVGEGENTLLELLACLANKKQTQGIAGTVYRENKTIITAPPRNRIENLDQLPQPTNHFRNTVFITSRGCPGSCTFCGSPAIWGKKLRFHSADYVINMFKTMVEEHNIRVFSVMDDTFTANRKRALAICNGMLKSKLNILWSCNTRVDALSEELLYAMRQAGCQRISLGVESASEKILKNINKRTTPEQVLSVTALAKKFGFQIRYFMMAGNRGETAKTLQESLDFIKKAQPNQVFYSVLQLEPGTEDFRIAREQGIIKSEVFFEPEYYRIATPMFAKVTPESEKLLSWIMENNYQEPWNYSVKEREEVLEIFPDLAAAHLDLAEACYFANKLEQAETAVKRALELDYALPGIAYNFLACLAASRGDLKATTNNLLIADKLEKHSLVQRNLANLKQWAEAGGPQSGKMLELTAKHNVEQTLTVEQPQHPANIVIREANSGKSLILAPQK